MTFLPCRVYDKERKKMFTIDDCSSWEGFFAFFEPHFEFQEECGKGHLIFNHFTGMYSNHGDMLFEDDICEYETTVTIEDDMGFTENRKVFKVGVVKWFPDGAQYRMEDHVGLWQVQRKLGNIHENPEIMKVHQ